jgi:hypothetical protein
MDSDIPPDLGSIRSGRASSRETRTATEQGALQELGRCKTPGARLADFLCGQAGIAHRPGLRPPFGDFGCGSGNTGRFTLFGYCGFTQKGRGGRLRQHRQ